MLIITPRIILFVVTFVYCYKDKFSGNKSLSSRQVQQASYLMLTPSIRQSLSHVPQENAFVDHVSDSQRSGLEQTTPVAGSPFA